MKSENIPQIIFISYIYVKKSHLDKKIKIERIKSLYGETKVSSFKSCSFVKILCIEIMLLYCILI